MVAKYRVSLFFLAQWTAGLPLLTVNHCWFSLFLQCQKTSLELFRMCAHVRGGKHTRWCSNIETIETKTSEKDVTPFFQLWTVAL